MTMKKIILTPFLLTVGLSLSACSNKNEPKSNKSKTPVSETNSQIDVSASIEIKQDQQTLDQSLMHALESEDYPAAYDAVDKGASLNLAIGEKGTVLHYLVLAKVPDKLAFMEYVLKKGARTDIQNSDGKTAADLLEEQKGSKLSKYYHQPVSAMLKEYTPKVETVAATPQPAPETSEVKVEASSVVVTTSDSSVPVSDVSTDVQVEINTTPVVQAEITASPTVEAQEKMIESEAAPEGLVQVKLFADSKESKKTFIEQQKSENISNGLKLLEAIQKQNLKTIKALLKKGTPIESKNSLEQTAFLLAVDKQNMTIVKYLVQNNADVYAVDAMKNNALHVAAKNNDAVMLNYLLNLKNHKLDVNALNQFQLSPLDLAKSFGKKGARSVKLLKANGALVGPNSK
jgi:hypothetical protein